MLMLTTTCSLRQPRRLLIPLLMFTDKMNWVDIITTVPYYIQAGLNSLMYNRVGALGTCRLPHRSERLPHSYIDKPSGCACSDR